MVKKKLDNPTVLVVDDDDDLRELMRMSLNRRGCHVVEAANGREAVELAQQVRPALILMDLEMPLLDGCEATRQIREKDELRNVPVIAVSAHTDTQNRRQALAAGFVEFVSKPVDAAVLGEVITRHLEAQQ